MRFGFHATLGDALAATMGVRTVVTDPNGGADITGDIIGAVSETHVTFRADDGLEFTLPVATLRFVTAEPALSSGERA